MEPLNPLLILLAVISLGYAFGEICRQVKIPRVVGQIFAGILIGVPGFAGYVKGAQTMALLKFMAEMGILLLFFFVGLQVNPKKFVKVIPESILVSICNTALPLLGGLFVMHYLFGLSWIASAIIGMCLSMSAQAVSIDVLDEMKMLKTTVGKLIMTTATIDNVFDLVLISIIFALIRIAGGGLSTNVVLTDVSIFVIAIVAFRYVLIPLLLNLFTSERQLSALFTGAIVITLIMALLTEYLGLGGVIGALFAGIIVREVLLTGKKKQVWEEHNIAKAIHIISFGLFVPVFFVWVGINTEITAIFTNTALLLWMVAIALVGTVGGTLIGVLLHRGGTIGEGLIVGWGVAPKGDVELVIATLALGKNLFNEEVFSVLILMAFFTTLLAPIVFRYMVKKYAAKLLSTKKSKKQGL